MESDGGGGSSRRDKSLSSTQGMYVPRLGEDRDGVAPKCSYGVPVHCKTGNGVAGNCGEEIEEVDEQFLRMELEWRVVGLEKRLGCLERRKKKNMCWLYVMCLIVVLLVVPVATLLKWFM
ncbi:hypothetical protein PIB30_058292 [Stylosanthes scabra]|uniref:Transmembrane protein n=1 Tax=Stylosanthes scabra TaxID=79078 RepID=A0ABU6YJ86_9FABA|nr:hypothetical protein [Stylosanthes scabra]